MRIVHIDFDDLNSPLGGGQARRTFEINRRLAARHRITVFTSRYPGSRDRLVEGVEYRRVGLQSFPGNFLAFFALMPYLARQADQADLLVEDFTSPFTCGMTPLFSRTPVVAITQYFFAKFMAEKYHLPLDLLERYGLGVYPNIISLTRRVAEQIRQEHRRVRVSVIPNGVEPEFFEIPYRPQEHIAFIGRVDIHQKGLDVLLEAMKLIPKGQRPPLELYGGGRDVGRLVAMIERQGLSSDVTYRGKVVGLERLRAYEEARFLCIPSRYEEFAISSVETMAAGRAIVGSRDVGFEEVFSDRECGTLVPPDDPRALADAIQCLWTNPGLARQMGDAGRERARNYDWDVIALQQEKLYESIAGK